MNEFYIRNVLEAALLAAGKPLQLTELNQLFDESTRPTVEEIRAALDALASEYSNRGVEVKETAAGFRIQVRREFSAEISRLWPERPVRYSRALLETLALIAYRQPITRAEIEAVRGVAVNPNIIKTVIERNWVRVVGHRDVPGRPELLGTTREFLDYFGLRSLDELPPLADIKTLGEYNPQLELPGGGLPALEAPAAEVPAVEGETSSSEASVAVAAIEVTTETVVVELAEAAVEAAADGEASPSDATPEVVATTPVEADTVAQHDAEVEADTDTEAERTLSAGEDSTQQPIAEIAEAEDAEAQATESASESLDAMDEPSDEDADEDELSADGHGSRELVAGPRDLDT